MSPIDREQLGKQLQHFQSEDGPLVYAALAHARVQADLFYLARVRLVGAPQAGLETCERHGHDMAGAGCRRCGAQRQ